MWGAELSRGVDDGEENIMVHPPSKIPMSTAVRFLPLLRAPVRCVRCRFLKCDVYNLQCREARRYRCYTRVRCRYLQCCFVLLYGYCGAVQSNGCTAMESRFVCPWFFRGVGWSGVFDTGLFFCVVLAGLFESLGSQGRRLADAVSRRGRALARGAGAMPRRKRSRELLLIHV